MRLILSLIDSAYLHLCKKTITAMKWHSNTSKDRLKRHKEEMKVREEISKMHRVSNKLDWVEEAAKEAKRVR